MNALRTLARVVRALAGVACVSAASVAHAQAYPSRPVTLIVPYAPGGGTDAVARTLAKDLSADWGQPVVVENRAGAEGWIGTQRLLAQPADGHTVLIQLNSMLLWKWALPEAKIDLGTDLRLISKLQNSPMIALVKGDHPAASLRDFFGHCQKAAKPCSFGISTVAAQLAARQMAAAGALASASVVPYKGTAPMVNDLLGGHIDLALVSATLAVPLTSDGRAKALAVGTAVRYPRLPGTPTFAEAGYAIRGTTTWYGLMVKAGTPEPIVAAIAAAVARAGRKPAVIQAIEMQGGIPVFNTPEVFSREVLEEQQEIAPIAEKFLK